MMVTSIQYPGGTHQILCVIGHLIVLAGAIYKGRCEIKEMTSVGIRKYFQTTVSISTSDVYYGSYLLL